MSVSTGKEDLDLRGKDVREEDFADAVSTWLVLHLGRTDVWAAEWAMQSIRKVVRWQCGLDTLDEDLDRIINAWRYSGSRGAGIGTRKNNAALKSAYKVYLEWGKSNDLLNRAMWICFSEFNTRDINYALSTSNEELPVDEWGLWIQGDVESVDRTRRRITLDDVGVLW